MRLLKILTFDITNTILKTQASPGQLYAKTAQLHGIDITGNEIDAIYKPTWKRKCNDHPLYGRRLGHDLEEWWLDFVKRVFHNAGYTGPEETIKSVCHDLREKFSAGHYWEVLPHSREVLGKLRSNGLRLGVISNFDKSLEKALINHNLRKFFDFIVTAHNANCEKPDPRIFHMALKKAGCIASDAGHIGDDIDLDYRASRRAGLMPFLLDRHGTVLDTSDRMYDDIDRKYVMKDIMYLPTLVT